MNTLKTWHKKIAVLATALFVTACSMASSNFLSLTEGPYSTPCQSSAGYYNLAKSFITVKADWTVGTAIRELTFTGTTADIRRAPDPNAAFCLDYVGSPTANDTFIVEKTNGLLDSIKTTAEDKSFEIFQQLLNAAVDFAKVGLRASTSGGTERSLEYTLDPFDEAEVRILNSALKDAGFCMILGHGRPKSPNHYCGKGMNPTTRDHTLYDDKLQPAVPHRLPSKGIYYRPRLPYPVHFYKKADRQLPGGWISYKSIIVEMENIAPILSVAVDRTFFATRETTLKFNKGTLKDITITKTSELESIVKIPLVVVKALIALPAEIVSLRIGAVNHRRELIEAQNNLLNAQTSLNAAIAAQQPAGPAPGPASFAENPNICINQCQATTGRDETACRIQCGSGL